MDAKKFESLRQYQGEDQVVTSHELRLSLNREKSAEYVNVKSKIPSLDEALDGFRDGELITISGPTKNGKTLLAQTLTVNFARQTIFPLWFSFEVPARQFLSQFPEMPLIYMPGKLKPRAMDWFEDRVFESFLKYNSRIIFIDHLHYLVDLARQAQMSIEIGTIIRRLKTLAVQGNFVIFLLCHTKKGSSEGPLSFESLRDSSFIAQESDCVIMVKRTPEFGENTARARVEFHRRTGVMERVIYLQKTDGLLVERVPFPEET
ncbi:MAG: replicative DNA helicase [Syntrophus sp. PtaB.Bin138]|nr:MAG: replicative DNA helicase [Syntrophus sp. PtaB.Bin138]